MITAQDKLVTALGKVVTAQDKVVTAHLRAASCCARVVGITCRVCCCRFEWQVPVEIEPGRYMFRISPVRPLLCNCFVTDTRHENALLELLLPASCARGEDVSHRGCEDGCTEDVCRGEDVSHSRVSRPSPREG